MKYFEALPYVVVTSPTGQSAVYKNLMTRVSVIPTIMNNPLVFYTYDIQDGDTPEIIASKYYGDSYRFWIVMFCNQMLDPQWDWPLSGQNFNQFIADKYANSDVNAVYAFQKVITQQDTITGQLITETVNITEDEYNNLSPYNATVRFEDGSSTRIAVDKNTLSFYDYEVQKNEAKRTIKLLNKTYVQQIEKEFLQLVN
jgi:Base plate wedge protein 53